MTPTPEMIEAAISKLHEGAAITEAEISSALTAALALLPEEPIGWVWKLPDGDEWQYRDGSEKPDSLGLPKATAARVILQPVYAAPAPLPVAVKALEWHQHDTWRVAGSVVGRYTVRPCLATNFAGQWLLSRDSVTIRLYPSEEQAISGGQADYETLIRSALSQQEERRG